MKEKVVGTVSGVFALFAMLIILGVCVWGFVNLKELARSERGGPALAWAVVLLVDVICLTGLFGVQPNQGAVLQLFGNYVGTVIKPGLHWANPFYSKKRVSLRVRNFETAKLKVNDHDGNPIEIGAVVVWKVVDTAEAARITGTTPSAVSTALHRALAKLRTRLQDTADV